MKESNAVTGGDECDRWRSRMQWPEETNAVAGGDTFWTLITRVCCIILNWVHLKKSRIIFFVFVTYWQSMARFRKNDFFKWAQKIKSVFCFIPHTHERCDVQFFFVPYSALWFQSTHPRRVWLYGVQLHLAISVVSIHTPTKGVTIHRRMWKWSLAVFQSTHPRRVWRDDACDWSNPLRFQSTHPRRVWPRRDWKLQRLSVFQSTHPRRVWHPTEVYPNISDNVSIHTPTKGVTKKAV